MHSECVRCFVCWDNFAHTTHFDPDRPHVNMLLTGSMQPKALTSCCMHVENIHLRLEKTSAKI